MTLVENLARCRKRKMNFIKKDERPPKSPDPNPLEFHVRGAML